MDFARLENRSAAEIIHRNHPRYRDVWTQNWNQLLPERYPEVIVRVSSDLDVVEAVKFARENGLKLAVRGGGHAWCATPLRKGGMLIDLSGLSEVKIDPVARTAAIQPFISNQGYDAPTRTISIGFSRGSLSPGQSQWLFAERRHRVECKPVGTRSLERHRG